MKNLLTLFVVGAAIAALFVLANAAGSLGAPPPRHAYPAHRLVYWVCPMAPDGSNVTKPFGVCFRDFWGH